MTDCDLGCQPIGTIYGCPTDCPCDCHRSTMSTEVMKVAAATGELDPQRDAPTLSELADARDIADVATELRAPVVVALPNPFANNPEARKTIEEAAADMVNHPPHYTNHPSGVECIEITRHMTFLAGNAFKYVFRFEFKNGLQDLEKSGFYLDDAVRHADRIWIPGAESKGLRELHRVLQAEPNPYRLRIYSEFARGRLDLARQYLNALIEIS